MPTKHIVLTLVLFTSIQYAAAVLTNDAAATNINNICDEEYYLKKLAEYLQKKVDHQTQGLKQAALTATKYEIAAAAARAPEHRCLLGALAQLARHIATKKAEAAETQNTHLTNAIAAIHKQRGTIAAIIEFSKLKVAIDAGSVHGTATNSDTMLKFKVDHSGSPACVLPDESSARNIGGTQPKPAALLKMKLTDLQDVQKIHKLDKLTMQSGTSTCPTTANGHTVAQALNGCNWAGAGSAATADKETNYAGLTATPTAIYKITGSTKSCAKNVEEKQNSATNSDKLADLICEAMETQMPTAELPEFTGTNLQNNEIIQTAVAACTPAFNKLTKLDDIRSSEELKKYIKAKYGTDKDAFKSNFKALVETATVPVREGEEIKPKPISQITLESDTHAVMARLEKQRTETERMDRPADKHPNPKNDGTTTECNGINDKIECGNKNGCKYNDENRKCENDPAKATATAETTSKCSDKKNQDECKDGCKWKNNACKDSSISLNKKIF
uniref:Variant surface glycoprotein 481 n=1 Tax=Trypanosoma brucei TaxID=5691 RepID=M4SYV9_9TRYP|nr:variant surface glycoprotein 481 [Trypanosoma brucei]